MVDTQEQTQEVTQQSERRRGGDRRASGKTRVVIVDGHTLFRRGVRNILELENDIEVVGEAGTGREALATIEELTPDVVLMDLGLPAPNVHFDDHPNDVAMRNHAYGRGEALYRAVGATRVFPTPPYPSTHNLGTNRMSENPRDGVVNEWGQTHDVPNLFVSDGSQFTTGAAENPTLTIVALAIRQADHIASELSKGNI